MQSMALIRVNAVRNSIDHNTRIVVWWSLVWPPLALIRVNAVRNSIHHNTPIVMCDNSFYIHCHDKIKGYPICVHNLVLVLTDFYISYIYICDEWISLLHRWHILHHLIGQLTLSWLFWSFFGYFCQFVVPHHFPCSHDNDQIWSSIVS